MSVTKKEFEQFNMFHNFVKWETLALKESYINTPYEEVKEYLINKILINENTLKRINEYMEWLFQDEREKNNNDL